MKVTVKDCLKLDVFKNARIVAGVRCVDKRVKNVTVLEPKKIADIEKFIDGEGEIVLSGFFDMSNNVSEQIEIVKLLVKKGCAALVLFYVGTVIRHIDTQLADVAEKEGLPLIVMTNNSYSFSDVISGVMAQILYGDEFGNNLISNTIYHLLNFERHSTFQAAVREAAVNNNFQMLILSEDFNPVLTVETRHQTTVAEAIRLGKERDVEKSPVYTMIDVNGVLTYWGSVTLSGEKYLMFIVDNDDSYSAGEITKLAEIIEIAMGMWKYTPERDAKAEFIKALRRGNKSLAYSLKDEAGIVGSEILSVFYAKGIETSQTSRIISNFESTQGLNVMKITESEETHGVILSGKIGGEESDAAERKKCIDLFNEIKEEKGIRIFHVTGVDGIEGVGDAYRLISETWSFVENVFPYKRVFSKYELALVSNCINIQLQGGYVKRNYVELLQPFKEIGENKGRQLLDTLETFVLDAGMNSAKTSEFMEIHTNTVQYRLKRINDVLGVEITGNRVIPGLTIALALKRLEKVVI